MRLAKYIAGAGIASRRKAEELIFNGKVEVNGETVKTPQTLVESGDVVKVSGKPISPEEEHVYILLNKPEGFLTTMRDPHRRDTVTLLLKDIKERIFPVGRLDKDVSGLLLFTNDGDLAYRLTHPSFQIPKTYRVKVKGIITPKATKILREGVNLEEGKTAPAQVNKVRLNRQSNSSTFELIIFQGWKRQIKRMCREVGFPVINLQRIAFASLNAQDLPIGKYRHLTKMEVEKLKKVH